MIHAHRTEAELLRYFCRTFWGFEVVAVEHNGASGIESVARNQPEVVLVSLPAPDLAADTLVMRLCEESPTAKVIGLLNHCNEYLIHAVTKAGCHGLIYTPEEDLHSLGQLIERVRQGCVAASGRVQQVQRSLRMNPAAFPKLLTKREQEVLICIAHVMTDEEIGRQLGFSKANARSHLDHIMRKLGIHKVTKLIGWCADKGFNLAPMPVREKRGTQA
jgi:DNA-binding NarL/FixJ family response regulator